MPSTKEQGEGALPPTCSRVFIGEGSGVTIVKGMAGRGTPPPGATGCV